MMRKTVSIIIPVKPGGRVKALDGLACADYPVELVEVLVAHGKQPSCQRNQAAAQAGGDILYFLDDDSIVNPQFLQRLMRHYVDPAVVAVGGPSLTPTSDSLLQQAIGVAFASAFGGGGVRNRYRQAGKVRVTGDNELILCNLSFRKDVFLSFGGLDERLYPNEENELMDRLKHAGLLLVHDPELAVFRSQRPTFAAFIRQMYNYGRGRGEQTLISGRIKFITLIPALFLLYLCSLPFLVTSVYIIPLACYVMAALCSALFEALKAGKVNLIPRLLAIFSSLHLVYGAGLIVGLLAPRYGKSRREAGDITITRAKSFTDGYVKTTWLSS